MAVVVRLGDWELDEQARSVQAVQGAQEGRGYCSEPCLYILVSKNTYDLLGGTRVGGCLLYTSPSPRD